ncbi:MAG: T9SS type A sorting domain-containing protein [Candidatus Kapabacteria bacterium]|nr:T9SS type A sorting domain-containing protein [Candidatus Kapabacteria bacterium]
MGDAFEFDRSSLVNKEIADGSDLHVPVDFHPVVTGVHTLRFTYDNTAASPTETLLQGVGIVPRLVTANMDFAVTYVNDYPNKIMRTVKIANMSRTEWEYCDSVTITDLTTSAAGAIATAINADVYGSEGFRFDINALRIMNSDASVKTAATGLPVTLQPGQYIEIDAEFVATRPENLTASVTTVSDAETEQTSVWTGSGFDQDVTTDVTTVTTCVYDPKIITMTLTYNGAAGDAQQDIHVTKVSFDNPAQNSFKFENAADEGPFDLVPGETRDINFLFDPLTEGTHTETVTILSDIPDNPSDQVTLSCVAVHYDRSVSTRIPANMNKLDDTHQLFEIGDLGNVYLQLDAGEDMGMADITSIGFTLRYEPEFIKVLPSGITSAIPGYTVSNAMVDHETGQATFYLNGASFNHPGGTDLVKIEFGTYLPKTDKDNMDFTVVVDAGGSACVDMTATGSNVEVKKTCVYDLRKVQLSGTQYVLKPISPNPVRNHTDINFAIGMETYTTVEIFSSTGELVATPINKVMQTGKYSVVVPVNDLPSGTYWVVLKSGQFTQQQRMIIVK